jgi:hypothetical protein
LSSFLTNNFLQEGKANWFSYPKISVKQWISMILIIRDYYFENRDLCCARPGTGKKASL